jgi:hypothetical protein
MEDNQMKQTAVEWLIEHWKKLQSEGEKMSWGQIIQITELAKEMEKQQIIDAFQDSRILSITNNCSSGEQYFNETYK